MAAAGLRFIPFRFCFSCFSASPLLAVFRLLRFLCHENILRTCSRGRAGGAGEGKECFHSTFAEIREYPNGGSHIEITFIFRDVNHMWKCVGVYAHVCVRVCFCGWLEKLMNVFGILIKVALMRLCKNNKISKEYCDLL